MKLAFCIFKYYPFGGLERNFIRITEECVRRGHTVSIFTMLWEGEIPDTLSSGCNIINIPAVGVSNHARCASYVSNLSQALDGEEYDLIVGFNRMPGLDLYYCADVCFKADTRKRHSFLYRLTPRYKTYLELEKAVFAPSSATHILALSDIQRQIYQQEYMTPDERFHAVPAGIDKKRIRSCTSDDARVKARSELNVKDSDNILLMVGSDFRRKGVIRSIKAISALPDNLRSSTKLFVVGKGKPKSLLRVAERNGVDVIFTGAVNNVEEYLAASDILLHPAVSENTGNAIVEALISGTPVIATSNCGYAFHIREADAGKVIDGDSYTQEEFNRALCGAIQLLPSRADVWRANAIEYSDKTDFYSRPIAISDIIEERAKSLDKHKASK